MRGLVPEWDDSYISRLVPAAIMHRLNDINSWVDSDGFWWGFPYMYASRLVATGQPIVVLASKPLGQGRHDVKVVGDDGMVRVCEFGTFL